jgi:hypothetical protein
MIKGLDDVLGEGAFLDLSDALTTRIDGESPPTVFEGILDTDMEGAEWPPEGGVWVKVSVIWEDANIFLFFQDKNVYWGDGICFTADVAAAIGKLTFTRLMEFALTRGIEETRLVLPKNLADPFLNTCFDLESEGETTSTLIALIYEGCKIQEFTMWVRNGAAEGDKPEWLS